MDKKELRNTLKLHKKWLDGEEGGKRADLRGLDLRGVNLKRAILIGADLSCAYLNSVDLSGALFKI